jgi:hypothetical protein
MFLRDIDQVYLICIGYVMFNLPKKNMICFFGHIQLVLFVSLKL